VPYAQLAEVAERAGFCRGSHNTFRHATGRIVVIPDHGPQVIVRPLVRRIIAQMGLSADEYHAILDDL
jgi:predicted RNA binding protein YcfA (HicA-like mRNA interferase family)